MQRKDPRSEYQAHALLSHTPKAATWAQPVKRLTPIKKPGTIKGLMVKLLKG